MHECTNWECVILVGFDSFFHSANLLVRTQLQETIQRKYSWRLQIFKMTIKDDHLFIYIIGNCSIRFSAIRLSAFDFVRIKSIDPIIIKLPDGIFFYKYSIFIWKQKRCTINDSNELSVKIFQSLKSIAWKISFNLSDERKHENTITWFLWQEMFSVNYRWYHPITDFSIKT